MGRRPLPVGTWGTITFTELAPGKVRARASFRDMDGKTRQVSKFGTSKSSAQRALIETLRTRTGFSTNLINADTKFIVACEAWLREIEQSDRAESTKNQWRRCVNNRVRTSIGDLAISEVTIPVLDMTIASVAENVGPGAASTYKTVLSAVFGHIVRLGVIPSNPVAQTARLKSKKDEKRPKRALTAGEVSTLLALLKSDAQAQETGLTDLVTFMLGTGVRIGEALSLRGQYIDFSTHTVTIMSTLSDGKGKGVFVQDKTKSAAGYRVLALNQQVMDMLVRRSQMNWPDNSQGLVFPNSLGHIWQRGYATKELRRVLDPAGLSWVTFHTFRKTVATRLDEAGLTAREIADQLGHEQPSMTTDVYMGRKVVSEKVIDPLSW